MYTYLFFYKLTLFKGFNLIVIHTCHLGIHSRVHPWESSSLGVSKLISSPPNKKMNARLSVKKGLVVQNIGSCFKFGVFVMQENF